MKKIILKPEIKEETAEELKIMRKNFKLLRQANDWSVKELSKISGIDKKILVDIEEGEDFDVKHPLKLCDIHRIKPHKIFFQIV